MKRTIKIEYEWWAEDKEHPDHDYQDELTEHAERKIFEMFNQGFMSGGLYHTICEDIDEYDYKGWWEVTLVDNTVGK